MVDFTGFTAGKDDFVPVPEVFFTALLPVIDNVDELRITLYAFWNFSGQVRDPRFLRFSQILKDERLMAAFGATTEAQEKNLAQALERACARGTLLSAEQANDTYFFLNSVRGLAGLQGLVSGAWNPDDERALPLKLQPERPNIYALYEQNIGPLTPILSDTLREAEESYAVDWIEDAIKIAVTRNVRHWQYVDAILKSWKEKGRDGTDRRSAEEKRKRDSEGKYADFVNH